MGTDLVGVHKSQEEVLHDEEVLVADGGGRIEDDVHVEDRFANWRRRGQEVTSGQL